MKHIVTVIVIIASLLLCVGLAACGGDRDIERQLDRADAMMDSIPAEALIILQEIDRSRLGDADAARHALLLSQAYDKTAVDIADDSLIAIARDYYLTHPGRRDMLARAYYYSGVVAFNAADYPESIYYLSLADTLAAGVADHRLRGVANAMLAWSNSELLDLENEYRHAERALRFFTLADDSARISRQKLYVAICHLQLHRPAEALAMLDSPGCEQSAVTRASSLVELGRLDEFRAMMELNPALSNSSKLMSRYARQLVGIGNLVEADSALTRALRNAKNISDTASCMGVKAELLKSHHDYKHANAIIEHKLNDINNLLIATMHASQPEGYSEAIASINKIQQIEAESHNRFVLSIIVIIMVVVITTFIITMVTQRAQRKVKEADYKQQLAEAQNQCMRLKEDLGSLQNDFDSLRDKNSDLQQVYDSIMDIMTDYDAKSLKELTLKIIDELNGKVTEYFNIPSRDIESKSKIKAEISAILSSDRKKILEKHVDLMSPGLIDRMRNEGAKPMDIEVYVLEKLKMNNSIIMLLTNSISEKAVKSRRTRIHKLVEKLAGSITVVSTDQGESTGKTPEQPD
ncbi:MAG: hypothetical protein K2N66_06210 [Paramuribaculum sp.]|nr:hypothetical protein [Paramuribaculum sp.]